MSQLLKDLNMNYYTAVSPFWFVAVSVCRRSGLLLIAVSPFWFVAVLTIDRTEYWGKSNSKLRSIQAKDRRFPPRLTPNCTSYKSFKFGCILTIYTDMDSTTTYDYVSLSASMPRLAYDGLTAIAVCNDGNRSIFYAALHR